MSEDDILIITTVRITCFAFFCFLPLILNFKGTFAVVCIDIKSGRRNRLNKQLLCACNVVSIETKLLCYASRLNKFSVP